MIFKLYKCKTRKGIHHPLLAIDVENDTKTGAFTHGGIYGDIRHETSIWDKETKSPKNIWTTKRIDKYFDNQEEFVNFIKSLKKNSCTLIFFNLAYDENYFDEIVNHKSMLWSGTRLIMLKLKESEIKAIDLMNHVDGTLEDWIKYLKMSEKGIKKVKGSYGKARVMNDARATFELGTFIEDFYYNECNIPLMVTVGSASFRLFRQHFFRDYWQRKGEWWGDYERNAYYGGRVEVLKRGRRKTWGYDVNSMYLSIMYDKYLPDMLTCERVIKPDKNWRKYYNTFLGIYHVKVKAPYLHIPLLPYHTEDGKLNFPVGIFEGYWTNVELMKAESLGYEILKVYSFIYYRQAKKYFKEYAEFIWKRRQEYKKKKNRGMELMIKKMGNSCYGKFAQRNDTGYFGRMSDYPPPLPDIFEQFEVGNEIWIREAGEKIPPKYQFTGISVFITSYARLKLYEALEANEKNVIYYDTDSLKLLKPIKGVKVGANLGEWGSDTKGEFINYYRPKTYGKKRKGVPKRAKLVKSTKGEEVWEFEKPLRKKEAIRRKLIPNVWLTQRKVLLLMDDKRVWDKEEKESKPQEIKEARI